MPATPVPTGVRRALADAMGGWGPFTVREIVVLFGLHGFDEEAEAPEEQGVRRQTAANFVAAIDWSDTEQQRNFLDLVEEVLERYPPDPAESPLAPGRALRSALRRVGVTTGSAGRLSAPALPQSQIPYDAAPRPVPIVEVSDPLDIWPPGRVRLFLSHSAHIRREVAAIAEELESTTFACFVAHDQIQPSLRWQHVIESALDTCDVMVAVVTPEFRLSDWCGQEVGWALGRGLVVIPVSLTEQPYGFFGAFQAVQVRGRPAAEVARLVAHAIATGVFRRQRPGSERLIAPLASAVVQAFCSSGSSAIAARRFELLRQIPRGAWTQDTRTAVLAACESNERVQQATLPGGRSLVGSARDLVSGDDG
jgi:TIR domain